MTISLRGRMLALTFLVAVVAAACGGNANDAGSSGGTATGGKATGASTSSGSSGSSGGAGRDGGYGDSTGASGDSGDHSMGSGDSEGENEDGPTVQADNFAFNPTTVSVESGEDLYLKNGNTTTLHTFTVEGTDIDVELAPLASDEVKVDLDPGTYDFHCRIHAQMTGTLTVT
jgi:plastocyanin